MIGRTAYRADAGQISRMTPSIMGRAAYRVSRSPSVPGGSGQALPSVRHHRIMREMGSCKKGHLNGTLGFYISTEFPAPTKKRAPQCSARFPFFGGLIKKGLSRQNRHPHRENSRPHRMPWEERELEKRAPDGFPHLQKALLKKAPPLTFYLLRYPIFTIKKYTIGARSSLYTAKGRRVMRPTRAMNVLMASQPK